MTIEEYLIYATDFLSKKSVGTARLDSLLLMEYILNTDRAKLLHSPTTVITPTQQLVLNKVLKIRARHIPIPYITHNKEFYGKNFFINKHVLVPRPESETMIDVVKDLVMHEDGLKRLCKRVGFISAADIGTGSGALGITAMLELPNLKVDLIDIDKKAIKVAAKNVVLHTIDTNVIISNLLISTAKPYDILLCNLPYIPDDFQINLAASNEPKIAIFGGKDGLDIYHKLFKSMVNRQHKALYILTESLPSQHAGLQALAKTYGYSLTRTDDFIQLFSLV